VARAAVYDRFWIAHRADRCCEYVKVDAQWYLDVEPGDKFWAWPALKHTPLGGNLAMVLANRDVMASSRLPASIFEQVVTLLCLVLLAIEKAQRQAKCQVA